ncbi:oligosaccharide flippase family protein [Acinetobacter sp. MD2(2019)]|uniref:oligosaccharide flippase family protein n=1 Tax=Acinetobacter sp. MD2(2019) TaxID=2605273 RepID=UPI002D1F3AF4|nr:oligosaccharide flippase family protein [Acinetobacter sp. MD2(2019)]MEB3754419.1 oligosaccharide flippase family protein [Acinetobacter sp. MD2(2019)]
MSKKVYLNSIWMMAEKLLSIFGLIFVTSFVARYIGPANFGKLTFATSIFAIVQTLSLFGSDNLIFQKTSQNRKTGEHLIYASRALRNVFFAFFASAVLLYLYLTVDALTFIFSVAACMGVYFSLHDTAYSLYFNATLQSKFNTMCNVVAIVVSLTVRFLIAKLQLPVSYLSLPIVLVALVPFLMRRVIFQRKQLSNPQKMGAKLAHYRGYVLKVGRKLVLYSLSIAIFTKTSQLFLGMKSQHDLGIYSVAMTLGSSFYFVLNAFISSFLTQIYAEKDFERSQNMVARLNLMVIVIASSAAVFFALFGHWIIAWLYGAAYQQVNDLLVIAVFVTLFSGMSTVAEKYLIKFNAYDYLHHKTLLLVAFNVLITFFAIHYFALYGAIFAILATEILSLTLFNYFYKRGLILDTHLRIFKPSTYCKR